MKIKRLVTALSLSLASISAVEAARYRVVEVPVADKGVHSFSAAINNQGETAVNISSAFNPPIDITLLNFEDESFTNTLTDPEGVQAGNINATDMLTLFNFIEGNENNQFVQQLGETQSFLFNDGTDVSDIVAFDVVTDDTNGLTRSNTTVTTDINNNSVIVGTSQDPYYKVDYTNGNGTDLTFVVHDFNNYGFVEMNGQAYPVLPPDTVFGGYSEANGVNDSLQVVGLGSTNPVDGLQDAEDDCNDDEARGDTPVESCIQSVLNGDLTRSYTTRGMLWQLDSDGNTLSQKTLGILFTPEADDTNRYISRASAINNNGIAVGVSHDFYRDTNLIREFAAIFDGDEVIGITDHEQYSGSAATDINDNNIVVGFAFRNVNGLVRSKFFYHDINSGETTYPADFFNSSASLARSINNNNLIVGEGDVEISSSSQRRKEGYIFDIESGDFANLNDLTACDSPYTIVQANDINDNNEIAATAEVYTQRRDITGTLETDDNGDPVLQNKTIAVKLIPIPGGTADDCSDEEETFERSGASTLYLLVPMLLGFALRMRRFSFKK